VPLSCSVFRVSLPLILLSLSGGVSAVGLGELRGQPALGERLQLSIVLLGADKQVLDATCFRLIQPSGAGDLPWLKKAAMSIRKSTPPVLEIRSEIPLREPIMQLAVQMTCGVEVSREYVLLASPMMPPQSLPPHVLRVKYSVKCSAHRFKLRREWFGHAQRLLSRLTCFPV
jgi:Tfp pilus assembly protein FimV